MITSKSTSSKKPAPPKDVDEDTEGSRKLSYFEKKEFSGLEKEIEKLEKRKGVIEEQFLDTNLTSQEIETLSIELGEIRNDIDTKEMRWLELSEYV